MSGLAKPKYVAGDVAGNLHTIIEVSTTERFSGYVAYHCRCGTCGATHTWRSSQIHRWVQRGGCPWCVGCRKGWKEIIAAADAGEPYAEIARRLNTTDSRIQYICKKTASGDISHGRKQGTLNKQTRYNVGDVVADKEITGVATRRDARYVVYIATCRNCSRSNVPLSLRHVHLRKRGCPYCVYDLKKLANAARNAEIGAAMQRGDSLTVVAKRYKITRERARQITAKSVAMVELHARLSCVSDTALRLAVLRLGFKAISGLLKKAEVYTVHQKVDPQCPDTSPTSPSAISSSSAEPSSVTATSSSPRPNSVTSSEQT